MRLLVAAALVSAVLAGCAGSDGGDDISISGEGPGPYTLRGPGGADNYTWDLGDKLTRLYGREVTHTYDFDSGVVHVRLTTRTGDVEQVHGPVPITIGSGENGAPTMYLDAQTNWTVPGETVRFSGAASTDPDGDPLRFAWSCLYEGPAVRIAPHPHGPTIGISYGTSAQGKVIPRLAPQPLPAPDTVIDGHLCDALGDGPRLGTAATIEGRFEETGIYKVTLVAGDPVNPTSVGQWSIIVSEPRDRPDPVFTQTFTGNLTLGASAAGAGELLYRAEHNIDLPLAARSANVTLQLTGPAGAVLAGSWAVLNGDVALHEGGTGTTPINEPFKAGGYTLRVDLDQGAAAVYSLTFSAPLVMDPFTIF